MSMNLLPWRTYQHQKRLRRLAFYIALFILLAINLMLAFSNLIEQQKQNLQAQQTSFEQLNQQLHKTTMQIDQLRSAVKVGEVLTSIPNEQVKKSLQQLSELPFQQGELNKFKQDACSRPRILRNITVKSEKSEILAISHFKRLKIAKFEK